MNRKKDEFDPVAIPHHDGGGRLGELHTEEPEERQSSAQAEVGTDAEFGPGEDTPAQTAEDGQPGDGQRGGGKP